MIKLPKLEALTKTLAIPSKAAILAALMAGQSLPASELAYRAGVGASAASFHLNQLLDDGFVRVRKIGRHRYYEINGHELAGILERFSILTPVLRQVRTPRGQTEQLRGARWCYDHLAGELGVNILHALRTRKLIKTRTRNFEFLYLPEMGKQFFLQLGIDLAALQNGRRKFAYECIDWSERRPHLAGALGAEMAAVFVQRGWVQRKKGDRAVLLTGNGQKWLHQNFGLEIST